MGFALPADDHFARVRVFAYGEGIVLFRKAVEPLENFVLFAFLFGVDRHGKHGAGEVDGVESEFRVLVAEGVARVGGGKFAHRADVARRKFGYRLLFFALQKIYLADAFGLARCGVVYAASRSERAAEDLHYVHFADEGVDDRLEHLRRERPVLRAGHLDHVVFFHARSEHFAPFFRAGHVFHDLVHKVDDAAVLQRRARHDGDRVHVVNAFADAVYGLVFGKGTLLKVFVEQCFVVFRGRFHKVCLHFGERAFEIFGNGNGLFLRLVREAVASLFERVHVPDHLVSFHDRDLDGRDFARVFFGQRRNRAFIVRVFLVYAVDEDDHGDLCFQAGIDALFRSDRKRARSARHDERAARGAKRFVAFPFKIVKPGNVEEVEFYPVPHGVRHGEGNGHLSRDLLFVVVGHRVAFGHFAEAVCRAAVEEDRLADGCLSLAAVPDDRNIPDVFRLDAHNFVLPYLRAEICKMPASHLLYNKTRAFSIGI